MISPSQFVPFETGVPLIASWDRVTSTIPDILTKIKNAVEEDNK